MPDVVDVPFDRVDDISLYNLRVVNIVEELATLVIGELVDHDSPSGIVRLVTGVIDLGVE